MADGFSYKLPFSTYRLDQSYNGFTCRGCVESGRHEFGKCPHVLRKDEVVNIDAEFYYICPDCYRDLQREGKIW